MTEQTLLPPPDPPAEPLSRHQLPLGGMSSRGSTVWVFSILAAAIFYLWQYPSTLGENTGEASALHELDQRLADIALGLITSSNDPRRILAKS